MIPAAAQLCGSEPSSISPALISCPAKMIVKVEEQKNNQKKTTS